jgi:hypothetical protein
MVGWRDRLAILVVYAGFASVWLERVQSINYTQLKSKCAGMSLKSRTHINGFGRIRAALDLYIERPGMAKKYEFFYGL